MKDNQEATRENKRNKLIAKTCNLNRDNLNEQLENCFITISKTQTEDEQSNSQSPSQFQTEKSKQTDENVSARDSAGANESRSYGKIFSDRISIEDSAELSLGKNLLHKIPNMPSSNNKEMHNQNMTKETQHLIEEKPYSKLIDKSKLLVISDDENNSSDYNPHLIYKKSPNNNEKQKIDQKPKLVNKSTEKIPGRELKEKNNRISKSKSKYDKLKPNSSTANLYNTNQIINSINNLLNNNNHQRNHPNLKKTLEDSNKQEILLLQQELTSLRQALFKMKKEKLNYEEENAILKLEKEKILTIKDSQIATIQEKISKFEIENKQLSEINEFSKKRLDEFTPKIWKYDELYEKYSKLVIENEKYLENNSTLNSLVVSTKKERDDTVKKFELNKIELDAIKNDKFYLSKENISLNEKVQTLNEKIKTLEDDLRDVRKTNQKYVDRLTEKNMNIENSYEEKLKKELEDVKRKFETDKENLKKIYDELAEKRVTYLTEEKDELKMKLLKLEKIVKEKEETAEFLNGEMRNLNKKTDEEISYLRIQLKIKSEDFNRISNLYEENMNLIKILKNENDSLKDKMDLIRSEMIKKESLMREEISELKSNNQIQKDKLNSYENIENELDKVIVDSAVIVNNDENNSNQNEVLSIIKDIPTSSKRRISQCLMLANKIKIMQIEIEKYKNLNEKLEKELRLANEEKEIFKNVAEKSKQP